MQTQNVRPHSPERSGSASLPPGAAHVWLPKARGKRDKATDQATRRRTCTLTVPCLGLATGESMQACAAERSRPVRQSFAELLSAKLVSLETDFGLEPKFGLHVIAGQVEISLKSARAAIDHATADDAPALNIRQGAVPPRLQEAEAMRLQRAFGINREYALRLLRERAIGSRSSSARRQVHTRTHRRLPVEYHCLEVQDAVEMQSEEPGRPTRANELLARCCQKWALRTAWGLWCRWAAAKAKTAAAPHRRLQCSRLRSNCVATSFKAWRARLSLTAEARRLTSGAQRGKRVMRWAWQHLVRSSVSRGLRIVPLQIAWRIWRTTAFAEATDADRLRRRQLYAALRAWEESAARTKAVLDRPSPLKLASPRTAAAQDQARWLLLRRAWAQWITPCIRSAKAEATFMKHALDKLKVSEVTTKHPPRCANWPNSMLLLYAGEQAPPRMVNLASPSGPICRRPFGTRHAHLRQRCKFPAAPAVHVAVDLSRRCIAGPRSAGQWPCSYAEMRYPLSQQCSVAPLVPCPLRRHGSGQLGSAGWDDVARGHLGREAVREVHGGFGGQRVRGEGGSCSGSR